MDSLFLVNNKAEHCQKKEKGESLTNERVGTLLSQKIGKAICNSLSVSNGGIHLGLHKR